MQTSLTIYTAAADNCLTLQEVKDELKVESSADDAVLAGKLDAAERLIEEYTNRRLMKAVLDFTLSAWPSEIVLPVSPVLTIDSIKYYDSANAQQTMSASDYHYNVNAEPCRITFVNGVPSLYEYRSDAITVRFTVGYSSSSTTAMQQAAVPGGLKQAILKVVGDLHAVRQDAPRERFTAWQLMAYPYRVFHAPNENNY